MKEIKVKKIIRSAQEAYYLTTLGRYETHNGLVFTVNSTVQGATIIAVKGTTFKYSDRIRYLLNYFTKDGRRNLKIWRKGNGLYGYVKSAEEIFQYMPMFNDQPIILTGHSFGAPTALHLADIMRLAGHNVVAWVGLGCPNSTLSKLPERDFHIINLMNSQDRAEKFPPTILGYRQPHPIHRLGTIGRKQRFGNMEDHQVSEYYKNCPDGLVIRFEGKS